MRIQCETIGPVSQIKRQQAFEILQSQVNSASSLRCSPNAFVPFLEFVTTEWKPNAALALKKDSMRIYNFNLDKHILATEDEKQPSRDSD